METTRPTFFDGVLLGAAAGAAGTTALNAMTYLDKVWRGRAASRTPQQMVERVEEMTPFDIPGDEDAHRNRVEGLGTLTGMAAGVGTGFAVALVRTAGWRPNRMVAIGVAAIAAMIAGNGPMTLLGVTEPRRWTAKEGRPTSCPTSRTEW